MNFILLSCSGNHMATYQTSSVYFDWGNRVVGVEKLASLFSSLFYTGTHITYIYPANKFTTNTYVYVAGCAWAVYMMHENSNIFGILCSFCNHSPLAYNARVIHQMCGANSFQTILFPDSTRHQYIFIFYSMYFIYYWSAFESYPIALLLLLPSFIWWTRATTAS